MTGIGVDDTRVDLSQFDEASAAGHSVPGTSCSPQPDIVITAGTPEDLEQTTAFIGETEGSNVGPLAETTRR